MSVVTITKDNFQQEVLDSQKTVLVDFWATWCGPCRMLSPVVDEIPEVAVDAPVMEESAVKDIPVDSEPVTDEESPIPEAVQDALAAQNIPNENQILSSEPTPKTMTQDEIAAMFADL